MTDEELHGHLVDQQGSRQGLNTPVLLIDLDGLTRNIAAMADFARSHGLQLRPHAKASPRQDPQEPGNRPAADGGRRHRRLLRQDRRGRGAG